MSDAAYNFGRFTWRELNSPDVARSQRFYGELFGWTFEDVTSGGHPYFVAKLGARMVGGIMATPEGVQAPPRWSSYVSLPDVDAAVATATAHGARILAGPMAAPGVGRFAYAMDPQGAVIVLFQAESGGGPIPAPEPGVFCWEELVTGDLAAAKAFYGAVCGWTAHDAPGMPDIATFHAGEGMVGSLAKVPPGERPAWLTHVVVAELAAARARVVALGGAILMPEIPVPGFGTYAVVRDDVGAPFCLFQPQMPA